MKTRIEGIIGKMLTGLLVATVFPAAAGEGQVDADVDKANSYDDAWEPAWVAHLRAIHKRAKDKTDGFVVHIGDSITYANQYGQFARSYRGDNEIGKTLQWTKCGFGDDFMKTPPDCKNGWSLAAFDHPAGGRSYTAQSGITAAQWLRGGKSMAAHLALLGCSVTLYNRTPENIALIRQRGAIKLEGGARVVPQVRAILDAGIVVCGHIGLTPQSTGQFGGYKAQGRTAESGRAMVEDAVALADAGVPMADLIAAVAIGKVDGQLVLDLCDVEDKYGEADMPVAMAPRFNSIVLLQLNGRLTPSEFKKGLALAQKGISEIYKLQQEALKKRFSASKPVEV